MPAADYRLLTDATGQRMATALEGMSVDRAAKTDLTDIIVTGTTNTTGATITAGAYFYLNGVLVQAKIDIGSGATFTSGTNYDAVSSGALNSLPKQEEQILQGNVQQNSTVTLTTPNIDGVHILILSRRNNSNFIMVSFDYWTQGYVTISGSAISGVTITKNALSHEITIKSTLGYALAYSCF